MQFRFGISSGYLAFSGPPTSRRLLVTDSGASAVHVVDVVRRVHAGYVAGPGTITGPRGVAARGSLVAVSTWEESLVLDGHAVWLFEAHIHDNATCWAVVRVLCPSKGDRPLCYHWGLRLTGDGARLAVADSGNDCVTQFLVEDGSFECVASTELNDPRDVEECEGGWLVACNMSHNIQFVSGDGGEGRARLGQLGTGDGEFCYPMTLALVPGLGLVVRELGNSGRLQFFATPDMLAMAGMSAGRVAWLAAVVRGGLWRGRQRAAESHPAGKTAAAGTFPR